MKNRKPPMRMCVACREMKDKKTLARLVRAPDEAGGAVELDIKGKKPGRGAYICRDPECLRKARKSRALERALGPISEEVYDSLERLLGEKAEDTGDEQ